MNVSYRWLRDLAPGIQESPEALAEKLGMLGAPVEDVLRPGEALGDVVVGRVLESLPHPDADRLSLCRVDAGGEPLQVVCGAPNVEEGALYPFAPVGATLPGGLEVRKATIRGEDSHGMLCSERELGLGTDASGIMRLADGHRAGAPLVDALALEDTRLTLEVTPNRPDLLSHVGVAREIAPDGHHGIELPPFPASDSDERTDATVPPLELRRFERAGPVGDTTVRIEDPAGCPRYIAAVLDDIEVGPSPAWLAARLRSIGQRPINNVVDATNYVLHELGQPLHAFDLDRLAGGAVIIRRAAAGERITTLDHVDRSLDPEMLVIADASSPIAIAGVMGGAHSEVSGSTRRVLLECAYFDPRSVRATARALGLSTDASYRFERGADIEGMEQAAHRAVELIQAVAGGRVEEAGVDVYPEPRQAPVVPIRPARVTQVLGEEIEPDRIERLLSHLGFELHERTGAALSFRVPGFRRHDVTREIDLIEEVARRFGYDRFDDRLRPFRPTPLPDAPLSELEDALRDFFVAQGLLEARSTPMAPEGGGEVPLLRPLSAEEGFLRSTLAYGLLRAAELNFARGVRDVRLFEIGTTFHATAPGERPREETRAAVLTSGSAYPEHWTGESRDRDLWDIRGLAESLVRRLDPAAGEVAPLAGDPGALTLPDLYRPGTVMELRAHGERVGVAGEIAEAQVDAPAWAAPVLALEVRLTLAMTERQRPSLVPVPTQPSSDRDLALLVPKTLPSSAVVSTIRAAAGELLERLEVFDVYEGKGVPEGRRSIAYRLVFRHPERTLKDAEVDQAIERILGKVRDVHGVERRG
ncbi:MAG: phenylalanine--tRNA ligase subunit beta [Gemmatimonadota bacterium]